MDTLTDKHGRADFVETKEWLIRMTLSSGVVVRITASDI
jgi:hypothetical protein